MIGIKYSGGLYIFPVTPDKIGYTGGNGKYDDVQVLEIGTMPFFEGTDLKGFSWTSFLVNKRYGYVERGGTIGITKGMKILEYLRDTGEVFTLYLTDINKRYRAQVRKFEPWKEAKKFLEYNIEIVEYRKPSLKYRINRGSAPKTQVAKSNPGRPPAATQSKTSTPSVQKTSSSSAKTYTVKKGDTLSQIAKKNGYKNWKDLYDKNKSVIGHNPNLIKPGQVLKL